MRKLPRKRVEELDALLRLPSATDGDLVGLDGDLGVPFDGQWGSLSEAQALFMGSYLFEMDVNNGGMHQFFSNQGPAAVQAALRSFKYSGLHAVAVLLQRAIDLVPGGLPDDHTELDDRIENQEEAFDAIDTEFFSLDAYPPLALERLKIVRGAIDDFFEPA